MGILSNQCSIQGLLKTGTRDNDLIIVHVCVLDNSFLTMAIRVALSEPIRKFRRGSLLIYRSLRMRPGEELGEKHIFQWLTTVTFSISKLSKMSAEPEVVEMKEAVGKTPKRRKSKAPSHPPYLEMIREALLALNEKHGSSTYAIAKFILGKHKAVLPANFKKILSLQLKNFAAKGKLKKIKASYKLAESRKGKVPTIIMEKKTRSATAARMKAEAATAANANAPVAPKSRKGSRKGSNNTVKVTQPRSVRTSVPRKAVTAAAV